MDSKRQTRHAVILHAYCDLDGRPCRPGINLVQSMMHAVRAIGPSLPEDFYLEAEVEIDTCPRVCSLSLKAEGRSACVCREGNMLAEAVHSEPEAGMFNLSGLADAAIPAIARRAH